MDYLEVHLPGFPVRFTLTPLEFFIFSHWFALTPWKCFFINFWCTPPPWIPTSFTLPPGIFYWYPQQGVQFFFWKSPYRDEDSTDNQELKKKTLKYGSRAELIRMEISRRGRCRGLEDLAFLNEVHDFFLALASLTYNSY